MQHRKLPITMRLADWVLLALLLCCFTGVLSSNSTRSSTACLSEIEQVLQKDSPDLQEALRGYLFNNDPRLSVNLTKRAGGPPVLSLFVPPAADLSIALAAVENDLAKEDLLLYHIALEEALHPNSEARIPTVLRNTTHCPAFTTTPFVSTIRMEDPGGLTLANGQTGSVRILSSTALCGGAVQYFRISGVLYPCCMGLRDVLSGVQGYSLPAFAFKPDNNSFMTRAVAGNPRTLFLPTEEALRQFDINKYISAAAINNATNTTSNGTNNSPMASAQRVRAMKERLLLLAHTSDDFVDLSAGLNPELRNMNVSTNLVSELKIKGVSSTCKQHITLSVLRTGSSSSNDSSITKGVEALFSASDSERLLSRGLKPEGTKSRRAQTPTPLPAPQALPQPTTGSVTPAALPLPPPEPALPPGVQNGLADIPPVVTPPSPMGESVTQFSSSDPFRGRRLRSRLIHPQGQRLEGTRSSVRLRRMHVSVNGTQLDGPRGDDKSSGAQADPSRLPNSTAPSRPSSFLADNGPVVNNGFELVVSTPSGARARVLKILQDCSGNRILLIDAVLLPCEFDTMEVDYEATAEMVAKALGNGTEAGNNTAAPSQRRPRRPTNSADPSLRGPTFVMMLLVMVVAVVVAL